MSIKTLRKRIALVAVSALGVGLLSVAPASAGSNITYGATSAVGVAGQVNIGIIASTTGSATPGATSTLSEPDEMRSVGFITKTSSKGFLVAGAIQLGDTSNANSINDDAATALVYQGAKIAWSVTSAATANVGVSAVASGGTLSDLACYGNAQAATPALNGSATTAFCDAASANVHHLGGVFNISSAVGSTATITFYGGANVDGTSTATNGDMLGTITFTVASASAAGVVSLADSTVAQQAAIAKGVAASTTVTYDTTSRIQNGNVGLIYVNLKDAYTSAVTTGTFSVTTTAGTVNAVVAGSAAAADSYSATTGFDSVANSSGAFYVYVNQPVANTAGSATVTMSLNGSVVGTKTLNWAGDAETITFLADSSSSNFANGYAAYSSGDAKNLNVAYVIKDAAGNAVTLSTQPTLTGQTGSMLGASLSAATDTTGTAAAGDIDTLYQTASNGYGLATMLIPSSALQGAGTYKLTFTNARGIAITTPAINATVSNGDIDSFTVSWDKATYAPGEIATVTITAKDAYGNLIADGIAAAGLSRVVSTAGLTQVGTALSTSSVFSGGKISEKYAAGNTEGAYSYSIDLTTSTPQSASVGAVTIKSTSTAVTNAEVLAAIVKLIASINKQIRALQKSLKR